MMEKEKKETGKERKQDDGKKKWLQYLATEVAVEYKACLYFFVILFFYAIYLILHQRYSAGLLHMAEMILATYGMGYLQVLALDNFDEAEHFTGKELYRTLLCSILYTTFSYLCGWFDRNLGATGIFLVYCIILYGCAYLANKAKRYIDTEQLNAMLRAYQEGGAGDEVCHRDAEFDEKLR